MPPSTTILIDQLGECGFRVSLGSDHVEAVSTWDGERFIVRGADQDSMVDELATLILAVMEA